MTPAEALHEIENIVERADFLLDAGWDFGWSSPRGVMAVSMAADEIKKIVAIIDNAWDSERKNAAAEPVVPVLPGVVAKEVDMCEGFEARRTTAAKTVRRPRSKKKARAR